MITMRWALLSLWPSQRPANRNGDLSDRWWSPINTRLNHNLMPRSLLNHVAWRTIGHTTCHGSTSRIGIATRTTRVTGIFGPTWPLAEPWKFDNWFSPSEDSSQSLRTSGESDKDEEEYCDCIWFCQSQEITRRLNIMWLTQAEKKPWECFYYFHFVAIWAGFHCSWNKISKTVTPQEGMSVRVPVLVGMVWLVNPSHCVVPMISLQFKPTVQ